MSPRLLPFVLAATLTGCGPPDHLTRIPAPPPSPGPALPRLEGYTLRVYLDPACQQCSGLQLSLVGLPGLRGLRVLFETSWTRAEARRLGITRTPLLILTDAQGKEVGRRTGHVATAEILAWIQSVQVY